MRAARAALLWGPLLAMLGRGVQRDVAADAVRRADIGTPPEPASAP